jgi:chemotaxis protein methyltransferase CheR
VTLRPGSAPDRLRAVVAAWTGLDLGGGHAESFLATLDRDARASGAPGAEARAEALLDGRAPLAAFVEELTVGETWFFRDPAQWGFVEEVVVPEALARRRGGPARFRAWSAGCATGEEPYTLAIVLDALGLREGVTLLASDLNEAALARAQRAEFSLWSLRGDVAGRVRARVREAAGRFVLDPELAARVRFFPLNLAGREYPSAARGLADLDLVLCRNVLIYLERAVAADVARRLFACLAPGGWLVAGAADPMLSRLAPFETRAGPFGVAYQRPAEAAAAVRRGRPPSPRPSAHPERSGADAESKGPPAHAGEEGGSATGGVTAGTVKDAGPAGGSATPGGAVGAPGAAGGGGLEAVRRLEDAGHLAEALADVDAVLARSPLDAEAHFEKAVVLTELGHPDAAEDACRRALYLERGQPFVHFFTAVLRLGRGDRAGAAGAFRTAAALAARLPPDEEVPLSRGMTAGALAEAARLHLERASGDGPASHGR